MLNNCQFIGRVSKEIEVKPLKNGGRVANLTLAVGEKYTTKDGEKKEIVEWVNVCVFADGLCGVIERFVKKGDLLHITGKMKTRSWEDQQGVTKYSTEIVINGFSGGMVMLGSPNNQSQQSETQRQHEEPKQQNQGYTPPPDLDDDLVDSIPF